jgi:transposase-like protein
MKDQQKTQKGQQVPQFTEDQAREYFEARRWPHGPFCPHCGSVAVYRLGGESTRDGLLKCRDCKGQFTVTVGTVMEDSHLPLSKWALAFHLMTSSKKGISALQLQRNLGLGSYKTAWHLAHRIRLAMTEEPVKSKLSGVVEVDETYIGGKPRPFHGKPESRRGRGTSKTPVVALVERNGNVRSHPIERVDGATLKGAIREHVVKGTTIMTDQLASYQGIDAWTGAPHMTVNHSQCEYVNGEASTNTVESYFSIMKRGIIGVFHHVSTKHLFRYCDEFSFRWCARYATDVERRDLAVDGIVGKRLMYKEPISG